MKCGYACPSPVSRPPFRGQAMLRLVLSARSVLLHDYLSSPAAYLCCHAPFACRKPAREMAGGCAMIRLELLILVPVAPALHYLWHLPPTWVFLAGILGVAVLADWIRAATEQLAQHTGPAVGGLLTVSLG